MPLENSKVSNLIEQILNGKISEIMPILDVNCKRGFRYPSVEELLGVPSEEAFRILESLAKNEILKKQFFGKFLLCPNCKSLNLRLSTHCPKCNSSNFFGCKVLEHLMCGYKGPEDEFKTDRGLVCPKCKKPLRVAEKDYRNLGVFYKCRVCGEMFKDITEKLHCLKCFGYFPKNEAEEIDIYSYQVNEEKKDRIKIELQPKYWIEEYLIKAGYNVQSKVKIRGKSGVEHEFDIFAIKSSGIFEHKLAIGISITDGEVGVDEVLKLFAKAYDVDADETILIAIPKINENAKQFANYHNIKIFEAEDLKKPLF
jgi:uncharacterized protein YbaR (Trm112 family)